MIQTLTLSISGTIPIQRILKLQLFIYLGVRVSFMYHIYDQAKSRSYV